MTETTLRPAARDLLKLFSSSPGGKNQSFLVQDGERNWLVRTKKNGKRQPDQMLGDEQQVIADAVLQGGHIAQCRGRCCNGDLKYRLTERGEKARARR